MIRVEEAEHFIHLQSRDFGTEIVAFDNCLGRVLAEAIYADRDFPPFNRVTMDGIAIRYEAFKKGIRSFSVKAIQSAGEAAVDITNDAQCIEIMTGAVLPDSADTIIPYEEVDIKNAIATLKTEAVKVRQHIHLQGKDKKQNEVLVSANQFITPAIIAILATVGKITLRVWKQPKVVMLSTGDELIDIYETPAAFQLRRSNNYTLQAALQQYGVKAAMLHLPDDPGIIDQQLALCLQEYDVLLLSGGVSMGRFDYIPTALQKLEVEKIFHKVQQRPGKPFWFGAHVKGALVYAFPGNPVSTFMCFHRYFLPWLKNCWQVKTDAIFALLKEDFSFKPALQYFLQVKLHCNENGQLIAVPVEGNGSGDFINLLQTDAFMELPLERTHFKKGEVFRVWPFKQIG